MNRLQELLTRDAEDEVIQSEILSTVVDAARDNLIATKFLGMRISPSSIPGDEITIPLQTRNSITVHKIGEGQEIPIDVEAYTTLTLKPEKYGVRPLITREMVEDLKFDVVSRNLQEAGYQMARKLESLILTEIETGNTAASHTVSGGTAITHANLVSAMNNLEVDGYEPDVLIIHPNVAADIRNIDTYTEKDKSGINDPSQRIIGKVLGMTIYISNLVTSNYAYVIDSRHALVLAEKRPITVEKYDDVTRDMTGIVITARWKASYLQANACSVITTS